MLDCECAQELSARSESSFVCVCVCVSECVCARAGKETIFSFLPCHSQSLGNLVNTVLNTPQNLVFAVGP